MQPFVGRTGVHLAPAMGHLMSIWTAVFGTPLQIEGKDRLAWAMKAIFNTAIEYVTEEAGEVLTITHGFKSLLGLLGDELCLGLFTQHP